MGLTPFLGEQPLLFLHSRDEKDLDYEVTKQRLTDSPCKSFFGPHRTYLDVCVTRPNKHVMYILASEKT